jgi:hypothetical protein
MLPWWQAHNIKIFQLEAPTLRSAAALSLTSEVRFCVAPSRARSRRFIADAKGEYLPSKSIVV